MTPDFTLSLSFEGIRLLHRVQEGWQTVGDVALDVADLPGALSDLRRAGEALAAPGTFQTKLLIPPAQIRFETIETARTTLDDVHAAVDGKTPYAIGDLVIDYEQSGGRTHIAAVARETLEEAEGFAVEHGFNPVAFVAAAEPFTFQAEVFFGTTQAAEGQDIAREDTPVRLENALPAPVADVEEPPSVEVIATPVAVSNVTLDDFAQDDSSADAGETKEEAEAPEPDVPADPDPADEPEPEQEPQVVFASRKKASAPVATEMPPPPVIEVPQPEGDPEPVIEPLFTRRKEPPALAVPVGAGAGPSVAAPSLDVPPAPAKPVVVDSPPAAPVTIDDHDQDIGTYDPVDSVPEPDRAPAAPIAAPAKPKRKSDDDMAVFGSKGATRGKPRFFALKLTAGLLVVMFLIALWANTWSEDGLAGLFRSDPETEVATAALEPIETPAPEILPVAEEPTEAPAPSALAPETAQATTEAPPLPVVRAPTGRILSPAEADRIYAATGVYQRAPRFALEPRISTLEGLRESEIVIAAPRPARAELPTTDALFQDLPLAAPLNPPPPGTTFQRDLRGFILATPDGIVTPDGALVIAGQPEIVPPLRPGTEVIAAPDPGAVFAENGEALRLIPGPPPLQPPLRPDDLAPQELSEATPEPVDPAADIAAAVADAVADEIAALEAPPEVATEAPVEESAQSEGTAPATEQEGLVVVAGTPPVTPPLRPQGLNSDEANASEAIAEDVIVVAGAPPLQPPARPATLAARAAEISAGGVDLAALRPDARQVPFADPALAGFRPAVRPAGLAPEIAEAEPEQPDITDVVAAIAQAAPASDFVNVTARAVPVSSRPDSRPRNFAQVVAAAQARTAQRQAQAASTQQTTTVTTSTRTAPTQQVSNRPAQPTGAIPTTVARAATVDNAIRLRDINLIGVYGRPNDRRALVRLGNGRFVKVEVGSALDGGKVTAIGDSALNYVKRGRTYALQLPRG